MTGMFVSAVVGIVLVVAGGSKLRDTEAHARVVIGYKILPDRLAGPIGRALPVLEIGLGAAMVGRVLLPVTGALVIALFLCYAAGLAVNLARGRTELDCGCFAFGHHEAPRITWWHVSRAVAFAGAAGLALALPGPAGTAPVVVGAALAGLVVALGFSASAVATTLTFGHSRVDGYLEAARAEQLQRRRVAGL